MSQTSKPSFSLRVRTRFIAPLISPSYNWLKSSRNNARLLSALVALSLVGGTMLVGCDGSKKVGGTTGTTGTPGTGGNTGTTPASGKGVINATFSNVSGTNATTTAFQSTIAQALTSTGAGGFTLFTAAGPSISGTSSRTFQVLLADNGPIQVGKTYTFSDTGVTSVSSITFTQSGLNGAQGWIANGGSAIVDSITGKNYKLRIINATFTVGADNTSGATGSFTVNGTANVTLP